MKNSDGIYYTVCENDTTFLHRHGRLTVDGITSQYCEADDQSFRREIIEVIDGHDDLFPCPICIVSELIFEDNELLFLRESNSGAFVYLAADISPKFRNRAHP